MSSPYVTPPVVKASALNCPNCGAPVKLRGFAHTLTVVCENCLSTLDSSTPRLRLMQKAQSRQKREPAIALGSRGKFGDTVFEAIGFQIRGIEFDGERFEWEEYVLFNPYQGFRYLTQYKGHWNFVTSVKKLPRITGGARPTAQLDNLSYKHFAHAQSEAYYVIGEFPWQARVGDRVEYDDYIAPPFILSSEITPSEVTWSRGEYLTGNQVFDAFGKKDAPPRAEGVFANQPSPYQGSVKGIWKTYGLLALLTLVAWIWFSASAANKLVFQKDFSFSTLAGGEPSFVTPVFELKSSRPKDVDIKIDTDLSNNWAFFGVALINEDTGTAYDEGKEVSFYSGRDSDGSWTEGGQRASIDIPQVPPGRYYLRVEPDMDKKTPARVDYRITVRHDTGVTWPFPLIIVLLLIPPIVHSIQAASFETQRWADSDYAPSASSSDDDDSSGDDD